MKEYTLEVGQVYDFITPTGIAMQIRIESTYMGDSIFTTEPAQYWVIGWGVGGGMGVPATEVNRLFNDNQAVLVGGE